MKEVSGQKSESNERTCAKRTIRENDRRNGALTGDAGASLSLSHASALLCALHCPAAPEYDQRFGLQCFCVMMSARDAAGSATPDDEVRQQGQTRPEETTALANDTKSETGSQKNEEKKATDGRMILGDGGQGSREEYDQTKTRSGDGEERSNEARRQASAQRSDAETAEAALRREATKDAAAAAWGAGCVGLHLLHTPLLHEVTWREAAVRSKSDERGGRQAERTARRNEDDPIHATDGEEGAQWVMFSGGARRIASMHQSLLHPLK